MKYRWRCNQCDFGFDEPQVFYERHDLPYCEGERTSCCPNCESSDYDEEVTCTMCGEHHAIGFMEKDGLYCRECYKKARYDAERCIMVAEKSGDTETVKINGAIYSVLDEEEINGILKNYILANHEFKKIDFSSFIDEADSDAMREVFGNV